MRTTYLIFIGLLISNLAHSQDWTLINPSYRYHYSSTTTSTYAEKVILVDSISESTYYLNRIVAPCDTCSDTTLYYRDAPQFLMKEYNTETSNFISDDKSFTLYPDSLTWNFNDRLGATLDTIQFKLTFGTSDSLKIFSLSNGGFIHLSKNYGITGFALEPNEANYLIGVDSLSTSSRWKLGTTYPKHWDVFNFEVGDVFQRLSYYEDQNCGSIADDCQEYMTKTTILDKWIIGDTLFYTVDVLKATKYGGYAENYAYIYRDLNYSTQIQKYYPNNSLFTSSFPGGLIFDPRSSTYLIVNVLNEKIFTVINEDFYPIINTQQELDGFDNNLSFKNKKFQQLNSGLLIEYNEGTSEFLSIKPGLGLHKDLLQGFEWEHRDTIMGYVKNGDTTGVVHTNDFIVATDNNLSLEKPALYPNPSSGFVHIDCNYEYYEISNSLGLVIKEGEYENQLDLSELEKGVYFLRVNSVNKNFIYKIFKE